MKKILLLTFLAVGLARIQAQGTMQFTITLNGANEVPSNNSPGTGSGMFTLNGTDLNYDFGGAVGGIIWSDQPTDATINGPANTDSTAPVLFDLGAPDFSYPFPPVPDGSYNYYFQGTININNLTGTQIADLENDLWYVNVYTSSGNYPGGEIRGQIASVPEPSALALLGLGIGTIGLCYRRKMP